MLYTVLSFGDIFYNSVPNLSPKFPIVTYGCQMNEQDLCILYCPISLIEGLNPFSYMYFNIAFNTLDSFSFSINIPPSDLLYKNIGSV